MPVNSQHEQYVAFSPRWKRCRDVAKGTDAVKAAGHDYLPPLASQKTEDYQKYLKRAVFYNATWRTMEGLVGMVFRKPPKIELPKKLDDLLANVDGAGQPLLLFLRKVVEEAVEVGRVGVLVDHPTAPPNATKADALRLNLRPTLQIYRTESIINWKLGTVNNQTVLVQLVLEECEAVAVDEFQSKDEKRWRVLDLVDSALTPSGKRYRQRRYKKRAGGQTSQAEEFELIGEDLLPTMNGQPLEFIPFVITGDDDATFDIDEPPLIDLVDLNLAHYRNSATYERALAFCVPTMFISGYRKEDGENDVIQVGSETAITQANDTAQAKYIEFTGQGLAPLENAMDRKEAQMAILGAQMLQMPKKGVEAADTEAMRRKGEESSLASRAQVISKKMTQAIKWFVQWAGESETTALIELNRDFVPAKMPPAQLTALVTSWQKGAYSDQTLFENLQAGEIIAPEVTLQEEQERIKTSGPQLLAQQQASAPPLPQAA